LVVGKVPMFKNKNAEYKTEVVIVNWSSIGTNVIDREINKAYREGWLYVDNIPGKGKAVLIFRKMQS
jgi:hypothetical protein